jgi:hypothetical protein
LLLISIIIVFSPLNALCRGNSSGLRDEAVLRLLKGEKVFGLIVSSDEKLSKNLFDKIADDIKLKLKLIGVEIAGDWVLGGPYLYVDVDVLESDNNTYNGSVELSFKDEISFKKEDVTGYAPVWKLSGIFTSYSEDDIRKQIDEFFNQFFNVYLEANPNKNE